MSKKGPQTFTDNQNGAPNYFPNSFSGPVHNETYSEASIAVTGDAKRYDSSNDDNFSQCAKCLMSDTLHQCFRLV